MSISKEQLKLYAVAGSESLKEGVKLADAVEQAVKGGATIVQLREKHRSEEEIIDMAKGLIPVCHRYNVPLIINDSIRIAYKAGADGVHLGLTDGDIIYARRVLGENAIIGATAHNLHEAQAAWAAGADYLGCGAVFGSSTKKNTVPLSIEELNRICTQISVPVVAIGGINTENAMKLKGSGIDGIAVVSALFSQNDIQLAAAALRDILDKMEI